MTKQPYKILEILDWYDGPTIFIARIKDSHLHGNQLYFAFKVIDDYDDHSYSIGFIFVAVDQIRIREIKNDMIDIRDIILGSELRFLVIDTQSNTTISPLPFEKIEQRWLPPKFCRLTMEGSKKAGLKL